VICFGQSFGLKTTNVVINGIIVVNDRFKVQTILVNHSDSKRQASLISGIIVVNDLFCSIITTDHNQGCTGQSASV